MGEAICSKKREIASNLVERVANKSGEEIPNKYLHKHGFPEAIDEPSVWYHSLLIDFAMLASSTPAAVDELAKLRSALSSWGCFQVINHGIDGSFLEEMIENVKQFSALPVEEKLKCSGPDEKLVGYGTGKFSAGAQPADWNDALYLVLHPPEKRTLQFYPHKPEKYSGMIQEYTEKLAVIAEATYKAMARSLDLKDDCFLSHQVKNTLIKGRFIYYPSCPRPEHVLGVKPHSDGTYMTVLLPDNEVDGLQVLKDEHWYKVMTNGIYKSTVHRVVTNSEKHKVSVAAFWIPEDGYEIGPISELVSREKQQK
ncbi:hypothetical protein RND81_08G072200 [Saponaria officinalis]|uniref:Fe2OG dioxygenase domain-containing protein n=1 Tax=Saponaria officinalis TaxID=3572 RepID=A0AAW1J3H8_SAPOF